jgi:Uncharacterised nucleotidyltransferase
MAIASLKNMRAFEREWNALRECVSPLCNRERAASFFSAVDWPRLLLLAEEHGVVGQLLASLNDCHAPDVPHEIKQALLDHERTRNFLTLRLTAELFRLLELFRSSGISALAIKGPALAAEAYSDPSARSYGDLDLLVRQRDIRRATELMTAGGYAPAVSLDAIDRGKIPGQYLFSKPDANLLVELHNDLTLRYFPKPLPLEDFFGRQIQLRLDGHEVPAPCVEDHLVLICVHGAKHFWERLCWIADVAGLVALQTSLDGERASASAKAVRAEHLLHTGLRLAMDVLDARLPEPMATRVRGDAAAAKLVARVLRWLPAAGYAPPGLFERAAFRLRMRGNVLAAPAYLLRLSFSATEEDWQSHGRLTHNRVFDALRRPFRLAHKYGRHSKT